jgi:Xaa-Pro aminopeptidase
MTRLEKVKSLLDELNLDAFLITHVPNVRYLTGFSGSAASLLITKEKNYFFSDFRYKEQSFQQVKGFEIIINYNGTSEFKTIVQDAGFKKIGFESSRMTIAALDRYKKANETVDYQPVNERIEAINMEKTDEELAILRKAAEISDKTFEKILGFIKPGITELEVSAEITYIQKKLGALKDSFDPIVASGSRGAMPHGIASDKIINNGEMVTLDFGCVYNGFCSDLTRTIAVGEPSEEMKKIYCIVYDAQKLAIDNAKAGMSSKSLDSVARDFITSKGYGENFGHGLGHGLGIEVHELPGINQRQDFVTANNSVVTIEPGIYLENTGGVRIEDDVVLKTGGCEILNKAPKELIII